MTRKVTGYLSECPVCGGEIFSEDEPQLSDSVAHPKCLFG